MLRKLTTAMVLMGAAGMASATTISYDFNLPEQTTEIGQTGSLNLFDTSLGTLDSVSFYVDGSATTDITLKNTAAQAQDVQATSSVKLRYTSSIAALNTFLSSKNPAVTLNFSTPVVTIPANGTYDSGSLKKSDQSTTWTTGTGLSNTWFEGTGTFDIGCTSLSGIGVDGGGGNVTASQTTTAGCSAHVTYDYTPTTTQTPEPASISLMGLGLAGLGVWRRRKA